MIRWLTVTAFVSVIALSACGTVQEKETVEEVVQNNSTTDIEVAYKEEIILEPVEEDEASEEAKSSEKVSDGSEEKPEEREQNPVGESEEAAERTEEMPVGKDPVEEEEKVSKSEGKTNPEEKPALEAPAEEKISEMQKATDFDHYPKGQFAVDGSEGQTVKNSTGEFTIEKSTIVSPVSIGPMNIQIENIKLVSGKVTEESIAGISGDQVRFLQVDAILQNTSDNPLQFFFASTTLQLKGQRLTAHGMFSGITDGNYDTQAPRNATLVYMLNENHLATDQIKNLTVNILANPTNKVTGAEVGTGTSLDISF